MPQKITLLRQVQFFSITNHSRGKCLHAPRSCFIELFVASRSIRVAGGNAFSKDQCNHHKKIASLGLTAKKHLGRSITDLSSSLHDMKDKFGLNVCGEGGEYETLTLDCDLYKKRIVIDNAHVESIQDDGITEVALYIIDKCHCEPKVTSQAEQKIMLDVKDSNQLAEDIVLAPPKYKKVGKHIHLSSICAQNCDALAEETRAVMAAMKESLEALGASMRKMYYLCIYLLMIFQTLRL